MDTLIEIREREGVFEIWGKWDDGRCLDVLVKVPFNDLMKNDKKKSKFLAKEIRDFIRETSLNLEDNFWKGLERYQLEKCDLKSPIPYKITDKKCGETVARFLQKEAAQECVDILNKKCSIV